MCNPYTINNSKPFIGTKVQNENIDNMKLKHHNNKIKIMKVIGEKPKVYHDLIPLLTPFTHMSRKSISNFQFGIPFLLREKQLDGVF